MVSTSSSGPSRRMREKRFKFTWKGTEPFGILAYSSAVESAKTLGYVFRVLKLLDALTKAASRSVNRIASTSCSNCSIRACPEQILSYANRTYWTCMATAHAHATLAVDMKLNSKSVFCIAMRTCLSGNHTDQPIVLCTWRLQVQVGEEKLWMPRISEKHRKSLRATVPSWRGTMPSMVKWHEG